MRLSLNLGFILLAFRLQPNKTWRKTAALVLRIDEILKKAKVARTSK